jgi:hypothetical protein
VGIERGRVNRTTLCKISEKWKSRSAKKTEGVSNFKTPRDLLTPKTPARTKATGAKELSSYSSFFTATFTFTITSRCSFTGTS